ncbi:shikimate dehydrogenase [Pontibacillus halophilus JSM 076056 = DSM 19796]|uniref:Shikimate dehydrogenase (NADP(+)) n=1 Tax=Pontibacillus halophilus JSM 076056 = DSM 19796 TaxID=1385510 RepID=A0A0A5GQQ6_9BACI|nr:shikimate dehydrogenase [Pontibacillus halophilus]KGX93553.1 shikimate dehydrogenase [Pontibacillus halophilus JSM 076056 = DSM 19796]
MNKYLFGVIGYPAKHSKSPWIHTNFLEEAQLEGLYRAIEVKPDDLSEAIKGFKALEMDGFNVTVPFKEAILPYLDEIDSYAAKIGAVNTVALENGKWKGYNTDGKGFVRSLREAYPSFDFPAGKALVIGAGGAAKGIYHALLEEEMVQVDVTNRTTEKAMKIIGNHAHEGQTHVLSLQEAEEKISDYDVIVQTTSVGMVPNTKDQVLSLAGVSSHAIVCDIVYKPFHTSFLLEAEQRGANVLHGHGMLLYQAALAFEIWTGKRVEATQLLKEFEQQVKDDEHANR